jgi:hypothetical protein
MHLWNIGLLPQNYMAHPRKLSCSYFPSWERGISQWGTVGQSQVLTLPGPAFWLDSILVIGCQAQLSMILLSILKFLVFSRISVASFSRRSIHLAALFNTEVLLKSVQWPSW